MKELAAAGIPVAVSCRVLKLARQPYYRWLANPVTDAELAGVSSLLPQRLLVWRQDDDGDVGGWSTLPARSGRPGLSGQEDQPELTDLHFIVSG